ncbi:HD domain-containing protein [Paenibacillus sp. 1001270B_150601_E10]|uniref:HD domain-containing protein n=1 Tax=Paenibacillus sp. 1001270B_150601_E10 TaxID=2787079 RepID=UPI0018A039CB|nr:HD domain-containing protein [Paenibacillus sp. 1001270B_150601_E10]
MEFVEELGLVRSINDPIHGVIHLTMEEMSVVESPLFNRLHHVRQNSFLYKVFPSAKHTRFEHSIGVMNYAHQMLLAVLENGYIAKRRGDIANSEDDFNSALTRGVGIDLNGHLRENKELFKQTFIELRLAALLHDIGHGPLSHLFDAFAPNVDEFLRIISSDENVGGDDIFISSIKQLLRDYELKQIKKEKTDVRIEHEHVSCYFIYKILHKIGCSQESIYNILTILKPELALGKLMVPIFNQEYDILQLLNDIVASAPIDCDRMDYLKRDSYFAGVPYGNYSEARVLKSMLAYAINDKKIRLGLKQSGLHAVENFLQARYEMYVQVYGHKTNEACRAMLNYVTEEKGLNFTSWSEKQLTAKDFEELYVSLSDEQFINHLLKKLGKERKKTLEDIRKRNLWKRVYEVEEFIDEKDKVTTLSAKFSEGFEQIIKEFGESQLMKFSDERFPLKDMGQGAQLLEKSSLGYYVVSPQKIRTSSQIIQSLNNGLRILRVYSLNQERISEFKKFASEHILPQLTQISNKQNMENE